MGIFSAYARSSHHSFNQNEPVTTTDFAPNSKKTGMFVKRNNRRHTQISVPLDPLESQQYFESMAGYETRYRNLFANHQILEITYEELSLNTLRTLKRVLAFLGVESYFPLHSPVTKINTQSLSKKIRNYAALKNYFQHTPWQKFFTE